MLEEKKGLEKEPKNTQTEAPKENAAKSDVKTKDYTVISAVTLDKVYVPGNTITVEVGSETEKYLLNNQKVNKHGISRPN